MPAMRSALALLGTRAAGVLAAVILCWGSGRAALAANFIDYLYVEANEGDSSGGHVALRFGDQTFHFQHESPGILRLQRHSAAAFHHAYAILGNRSIRESRIAVSDDTYTLLRDAFVRLQLVQGAQLEIRDALHRDVALFELLLKQSREHPHQVIVPLSTLGYFLPAPPGSDKQLPAPPPQARAGGAPSSPALVSLRERIRAGHGELFLTDRVIRAKAVLQGVELTATGHLPPISRDAFPSFEPTASTRYRDALLALFALQLLQSAPQLREGTFWSTQASDFRLEKEETLALKRFRSQLEDELVALLYSPRTDWGLPFLVGMARLSAVEASLASGRLVLLDIFPPDGQLPARQDSALRPYLPIMEGDLREVFLQKRKRFFTAEAFREADYAALERSGNLLLDLQRAIATGTPLRTTVENPFPLREAKVAVPFPGALEEATLLRELDAAKAAERDYNARLARLYSYDLFSRNCVTELFEVINGTLASRAGGSISPALPETIAGPAVRSESLRRLGGFVDASKGLTFIPILSMGAVENSYAVVESREIPSYRKARLAEMKEREASLKVMLRESNTITSSVYRPGADDSAFLFFTDDTVLARPLFGAFNLLTGLGEGLYGVLTMPVAGPGRLILGSRGVLFSLPELFFFSLRKGSMAYVEQSAEQAR